MENNKKISVLTGSQFEVKYNWDKVLEALEEDRDLSAKQKAYQGLVLYALSKYNAETMDDLSDGDKSKFFDFIKDNWDKGKGEVKDKDVKKEIEDAQKSGDIEKPEKID
jgi:hypothetical protein